MQARHPGWTDRSNLSRLRHHYLRILGVNDNDPTLQVGPGMTCTQDAEGVYTVTWAEDPGTFVGWSPAFGADTPTALLGYTAVRDTYDTSAFSLSFTIGSAANAAADLIAAQYLDVCFTFTADDQLT
jgi:hypothetical protein